MTQIPERNHIPEELEAEILEPEISDVETSPIPAATQLVLQGISNFQWNSDYKRFCEVLGLREDRYSTDKWGNFQELYSVLNKFDLEEMVKIIEAGSSPIQEVGSPTEDDSISTDLNDL